MKKTNIYCIILLSASTATAADASDFYATVHVGASTIDDQASADIGNDGVSLDGALFDSTETAFGLTAGWQVLPWLAVEVGYEDLGESGVSQPAPFGFPQPVTSLGGPFISPGTPTLLPDVDLTGVPGVTTIGLINPLFGTALGTDSAALNVEQWQVGAKMRKTLGARFDAHWYLGLARSSFDVRGQRTVLVPTGLSFPDPTVTLGRAPNARPDAEFGINWGAGFDWHATQRMDAGLQWRRHHTGVIDIDSYRVSWSWRF